MKGHDIVGLRLFFKLEIISSSTESDHRMDPTKEGEMQKEDSLFFFFKFILLQVIILTIPTPVTTHGIQALHLVHWETHFKPTDYHSTAPRGEIFMIRQFSSKGISSLT